MKRIVSVLAAAFAALTVSTAAAQPPYMTLNHTSRFQC